MLYDIIKGHDEIFVLILISSCKIYIVLDNVVISTILITYQPELYLYIFWGATSSVPFVCLVTYFCACGVSCLVSTYTQLSTGTIFEKYYSRRVAVIWVLLPPNDTSNIIFFIFLLIIMMSIEFTVQYPRKWIKRRALGKLLLWPLDKNRKSCGLDCT